MKRVIYIFFVIITFMQSCRLNKDIDFSEFNELSSMVLKNYKLHDTIVFKSNKNNYDTIKIVAIDTIDNSRPYVGMTRLPFSMSLRLEVQHLPIGKSYGRFLKSKRGKLDSIGHQDFISLEAEYENEPLYSCYLYFKDASGEISLLKENDTMKKSKFRKQKFIHELYWSKEKGLTGYKTVENEIFSLINRK